MTAWRIDSLLIGELYLPHGGGIQRDPVHVWLARDGKHNVLIDSGMAEIALITKRLKVEGWGGGHAKLTELLAGQGLTPGDIDHVNRVDRHVFDT